MINAFWTRIYVCVRMYRFFHGLLYSAWHATKSSIYTAIYIWSKYCFARALFHLVHLSVHCAMCSSFGSYTATNLEMYKILQLSQNRTFFFCSGNLVSECSFMHRFLHNIIQMCILERKKTIHKMCRISQFSNNVATSICTPLAMTVCSVKFGYTFLFQFFFGLFIDFIIHRIQILRIF